MTLCPAPLPVHIFHQCEPHLSFWLLKFSRLVELYGFVLNFQWVNTESSAIKASQHPHCYPASYWHDPTHTLFLWPWLMDLRCWLCCLLIPDSFPLADWELWHHSDSFCFALFILLLSFSILCLYDIISAYFLLMHPCLLICLLISFTQHLTQPLPFTYSPLLSLLPILYKFLANFLPST